MCGSVHAPSPRNPRRPPTAPRRYRREPQTLRPAHVPAASRPHAGDSYTGEQDSWPATRNELPQPQAATTFGFSTLKPAPVSASM